MLYNSENNLRDMKKLAVLICLISSLNVMSQQTFQYVNTEEVLNAFPDWKADIQNAQNALDSKRKKYYPLIEKCRISLKDSLDRYDLIVKSAYYTAEQRRELQSKMILAKQSECEQFSKDMMEEVKKEAKTYNYYSKIMANLNKRYKNNNIELIETTSAKIKLNEADYKENNIKNATPEIIQAIKDHIKKYKTLKMASLMKFKN